MHKTLLLLTCMFSDVPCELVDSWWTSWSRGTISSFMSSPFTLTVILSHFKWKSLRFVLTLTNCSKQIAIQQILTTRSEQTDQILSLTKWQYGRIRSDLKTKSDLCTVWTKALCWRKLRDFESRLTSPAEVSHGGHMYPWWRKPNDAGQLSTEETLSLCVRVLQMKPPEKQGAELSWSGFTLVPKTRKDSWIPTVDENWVKGPLLSTDRTPMRPCPHTQLIRQPSSPTLQHDCDFVRKEREWLSWLLLHSED